MNKTVDDMRELDIDELDAVSGAGPIVQAMEFARAMGYVVKEAADYARAHGSSCYG